MQCNNQYPVSFSWNLLYTCTLLSPDIQTQIENFNNFCIDGSQYSVDSASMELSNIMLNTAEKCLKRNPCKSSKNKKKNGLIKNCRNVEIDS